MQVIGSPPRCDSYAHGHHIDARVNELITEGIITSRTLSVEERAKGNQYWYVIEVVWISPPSASAP